MKRRQFIFYVGSTAYVGCTGATSRFPAWAQPATAPLAGFLRSASLDNAVPLVDAFRKGLKETGHVEGQNLRIELRSAEGHNERLPALVSELIGLGAAVIACNVTAASAAKKVTNTVPIVFATGDDPGREGLVTSLSRPGGNVTGVSFLGNELGAKQLQLLRELLPKAARIAVLVDTNFLLGGVLELKDLQSASQPLGLQLAEIRISTAADLESASATLMQQPADALLVLGAALFLSQRQRIVELAARHALPAIYQIRDFVDAGGLMSYGSSIRDAYRQVGIYAGKILGGAKPADLPVQQSVQVELIINLKTARALGLTIPQSLLFRADEVIE